MIRHYIETVEPISDDGRDYFVYRHFDDEGDLLYVGVTCNPERRPYAHRRTHWWPEVAHTEISGPTGRREAYRQEWMALRNESPAHNQTRRNGYWVFGRRYVTAEERAAWEREANIRAIEALEPIFTGIFAAAGVEARRPA